MSFKDKIFGAYLAQVMIPKRQYSNRCL